MSGSPKTLPNISAINKAAMIIAKPIAPEIIFERAAASFPLSPPEDIHWIPPEIRRKINQIPATRVSMPITFVMIFVNLPGEPLPPVPYVPIP